MFNSRASGLCVCFSVPSECFALFFFSSAIFFLHLSILAGGKNFLYYPHKNTETQEKLGSQRGCMTFQIIPLHAIFYVAQFQRGWIFLKIHSCIRVYFFVDGDSTVEKTTISRFWSAGKATTDLLSKAFELSFAWNSVYLLVYWRDNGVGVCQWIWRQPKYNSTRKRIIF